MLGGIRAFFIYMIHKKSRWIEQEQNQTMTKVRAAITGVGGYVPDYVLTNKELETMVETTDEWITTRTGIK